MVGEVLVFGSLEKMQMLADAPEFYMGKMVFSWKFEWG